MTLNACSERLDFSQPSQLFDLALASSSVRRSVGPRPPYGTNGDSPALARRANYSRVPS